jgi:hypothetical protein
MKTKISKKRAISTVLTTIIVLISSVVLGSGIIIFGISLFQAGSQQEQLSVFGPKIWVHATNEDGLSWGAAAIRNSGDTVLGIDLILVRGTPIPFSQWYVDQEVDAVLFSQVLNFTGWEGGGLVKTSGVCGGTRIAINNGQGDICGDKMEGPFTLLPGGIALVYYQIPNGTLTSLDSGVNTSLNIYASKAGSPQVITIQSRQ